MILDGAKVAQKIRNELKEKISKEKRAPILTVILVDSEMAGPSKIYVNYS